jgi:hypothetical protein
MNNIQIAASLDSQSEKGAPSVKSKKKGAEKRAGFFGKPANGGAAGTGASSTLKSRQPSESEKASMKLKGSIGSMSASIENDIEVPNLGKLVEILKTHKGSMQMQNFIKRASFNNLNTIIEEIKNDFGKLMIDQYGNYFC